MSFIDIGSTVAFGSALPHGHLRYLDRLRLQPFHPARRTLGKAGIYVNTVAMIYIFWACLWSFWPIGSELSAQTFNWAVVLSGGVMGIACLEYIVHAWRYHEGPVVKVEGKS